MYRCAATSIEGFVRQLAVAYVGHGYLFYVTGTIPDPKPPDQTDRKLIEQYDIDISRWTRARRKKLGLANVQYLRFERFFVLVATHGRHPFFEAEAKSIRDIRETPIRFQSYSIGYRRGGQDSKWHPSVRLDLQYYKELRAQFEAIAVHRSAEQIVGALRKLPFEPWAPIRRQLFGILWRVNEKRKSAALEPIPWSALQLRRRPVSPFAGARPRTDKVREHQKPASTLDVYPDAG